jgi:hypothetical protein
VRRRDGQHRDPTYSRAYGEEGLVRLVSALKMLEAREMGVILWRYGIKDGEPKTWSEIGEIYGLSGERIRVIENKAISKLRHPSKRASVEDFVDDWPHLPEAMRLKVLAELGQTIQPTAVPPVRYCERHGTWSDAVAPGLVRVTLDTCENCPCVLPPQRTGRRRRFCSNDCRQDAYRARRMKRK